MIRNFISLGRTPLLICFLFVFQTVIAQAPLISTINPTSGPPKTAVVISGSNFGATAAENIVYFGAVKAEVTAASPTSLTVLAPVGATYQPISVLNTATLLKGYSTESFVTTFTPNKGSITSSDIAPGVNFATVSNAGSGMEMGDFDGDGKIDLAVLNAINGSGAAVLIFRNTSGSDGQLFGICKRRYRSIANDRGCSFNHSDCFKSSWHVCNNGGRSIICELFNIIC